jgi:energy-coupling factor transporter ATP-binding protein EcfA2
VDGLYLSVINFKDFTYKYSEVEKPALREINLEIKEGEFVIITGPSGCGKTTLCRCFNGLIPHFYGGDIQGRLSVVGFDVKETPTSILSQYVGLVFQNPENQLFSLSVERDIAFGLENLGLDRKEIIERTNWALEITGIKDLREKAPYELSGGQQQRVAIASVLAMKPKVIVLDEPTSFLDPLSSKKILEVVNCLNKDLGLTIALVEHRLDLASIYADRIVVMDDGAIVSSGIPKKVFNDKDIWALGVGVPKITRLCQYLGEKGVDLGDVAITPDEAVDLIRRYMK